MPVLQQEPRNLAAKENLDRERQKRIEATTPIIRGIDAEDLWYPWYPNIKQEKQL